MSTDTPPSQNFQGSLFENVYIGGWPAPARFPTNASAPHVRGIVETDLAGSREPMLIAGFASLDRIVVWLAACRRRLAADHEAHRRIRLLLGNEPLAREHEGQQLRRRGASQRVIDYWLSRGISLHRSTDVLAALELLRGEMVEVRTSGERPVHAKIFVGDEAITIGSSNYTPAGLSYQVEANVRLTSSDGARFGEARGLAEAVWATGEDFRDGLIALLEQLLRPVSWQEALARACAELLEGSWAARYRDVSGIEELDQLWPSQEQGIAHALWVLEQQGSVLVADATGSGKTLMGAHLVKRVMTRLHHLGRGRGERAVLLAPPAVLPEWEKLASRCGAMLRGYSQGHLSHAATEHGEPLRDAISRTQVLAIDEAHNFLRQAKRTLALFSNIADHVLLFTATPVNRGPRDLLAIIDLLGADNLDDDTLDVLKRLWKRRGELGESMSADERERLRRAIRRFTVRRTKSDLNRMVTREPERYRSTSGEGRICRYPEHRPLTYECHEPERDLELATRIRAAAGRLRGLTRLTAPLELTEALRREGLTEEAYLAGRVRGAAALAAHEVAAGLRSSRARLLEHLIGTDAVLDQNPALRRTRVAPKPGVFHLLEQRRGHSPVSRLRIELPEWLRDPGAHRQACDEERATYAEIESLVRQMSDARERAKAELLASLARRHSLVLAFDSHLITLADLRERLSGDGPGSSAEIIVATGEAAAARRRLYERFRPESDARGIIALCSDALAEGVNLQGASVVVMLDMPSVIRVAEQRIGRVDRMNSPHEVIEAYWPVDPAPFAVRASERLVERHQFVRENLGSNLQLPRALDAQGADEIVRYEDYVAGLQAVAEGQDESGSEIEDVLAPVRRLVEGDAAIVPADVYEALRRSSARVLSSVSVVRSDHPFAFVAISGTEWGAPKWVYVPDRTGTPTTDLEEICAALRRHLGPDTEDHPLDDAAADAIAEVLTTLARKEELLLPRGKQRALSEMRYVLKRYASDPECDARRRRMATELLELATPGRIDAAVDRAALADWWLRTIQPVKFAHLRARARKRPVLLRNLRTDLMKTPIATEQLEKAFEAPLGAQPLEERVVAAVVGVGGSV
jgi:superfamily II DNA or RNA helicase